MIDGRYAGARASAFSTEAAEAWTGEWILRQARRAGVELDSVFVQTGLGRTHVLRSPPHASGRAVLCLPGWGTNVGFWCLGGDLGTLAAAGQLFLVDLPGHPGLSAGWAPTHGPDGYARWLEEVVDALGLGTVALMGSSLGGLLALEAAGRMGGRVDRVVLLAPAGFVLPLPTPRAALSLLRRLMRNSEASASRFVGACLLGPGQSLDGDPRVELDRFLVESARTFRMRVRIPPILRPPALSAVVAPVALLVGRRDAIFSASRTVARARRFLRTLDVVHVLDGHGHGLEFSREAMELAGAFLSLEGSADPALP